MNITILTNVRLWFAEPSPAFVAGELAIEGDRIVAIGRPDELDRRQADVIDGNGALVCPGLIELHSHGRAGGDFGLADREQMARTMRSYLHAGVTSLMPTLASEPFDSYGEAAALIAQTAKLAGTPRCLGIHMEGRYLNPDKRGAHAEDLLAATDADELERLHAQLSAPFDRDAIFRLTYAPELDQDGSFTQAALRLGFIPSIGHTTADFATASAAVDRGARSFTHLFNAMPSLHHRDGGAVAACFDAAADGKNVYGELICDGHHISPEMIRLAYRLLGPDHTLLVSDSMAGTGCPDGQYELAGESVTLKDGIARTATGALAGSTISLWNGVCNLARMCRIPLAEALLCATRNPARLCGMEDVIGTLRVGAYADLLLLGGTEDAPTIERILLGGRLIGEDA